MKARLLLLLLLALPLPAAAQPVAVEEDEPLVMRLIFQECLGYIRQGRAPFQGLETTPAPPEAIAMLNRHMPNRPAARLLFSRYLLAWGSDAGNSVCYVSIAMDRNGAMDGPARLGVRRQGFLARVGERAAAAGLSPEQKARDLPLLSTVSWRGPLTGSDSGPRRPVSLVLIGLGEATGRLAEISNIVVAGPPVAGGRRLDQAPKKP